MSPDLRRHLERQLRHDQWAHVEVRDALRALAPPPPATVRLYTHLIATEHLWIARIDRRESPAAVWPDWSLEDADPWRVELASLWAPVLERDADEPIEYTNSRGEPWTSTVIDIVTHVLQHSAYHRGQIASRLRADGHSPPYTDFVHATRAGLLD